jgi:hypothetical protein
MLIFGSLLTRLVHTISVLCGRSFLGFDPPDWCETTETEEKEHTPHDRTFTSGLDLVC